MERMISEYSEGSLEITRNPFDSGDLDRENLPGLSPVFRSASTGSAEKTNFRWSIDQLSLLRPADIDEFPLQEYSSIYSRDEEEQEAQRAIDEYFSTVTLPSPWLEEKEPCRSKRVTFSPHPPTTQYFMNESYESDKGGIQIERQKPQTADASCQTKLTFPVNIDLEKLLAKFVLKAPGLVTSKADTSFTSFRRKLFSGDDSTPNSSPEPSLETHDVVFQSPRKDPNKTDTISPVLITSSPFGASSEDEDHFDVDEIRRSSMMEDPSNSPSLSPVIDRNNNENNRRESQSIDITDYDQTPSNFDSDVVLKSTEHVVDSSRVADLKTNRNLLLSDTEPSLREDGITECSAEQTWNTNIIESTRVADIDINSMSPIKLEESIVEDMDLSISRNQDIDVMEMSCLPDCNQSVKESTARPLHGITCLGLSPIGDHSRETASHFQNSGGNVISHGNVSKKEDIEEKIPETLSLSDLATKQDEIEDFVEMEPVTPRSTDSQQMYVETPRKSGPHKGILKHTRRIDCETRVSRSASKFENFEHYFENRCKNLTSTIMEKSTPRGYVSRRPLSDIDANRKQSTNRSASKPKNHHFDMNRPSYKNTYGQLDEDLVIRQANAALCRADQLQRYDTYNYPNICDVPNSTRLHYHSGAYSTRCPKANIKDTASSRLEFENIDSGFSTTGEDNGYAYKRTSSRIEENRPTASGYRDVSMNIVFSKRTPGKENTVPSSAPPKRGQVRRVTWPSPSARNQARVYSVLPMKKSPQIPSKVPRSYSAPVLRYQEIDRQFDK